MGGGRWGEVAQVELSKSQSTLALFQVSQHLHGIRLHPYLFAPTLLLVYLLIRPFPSIRVNKY